MARDSSARTNAILVITCGGILMLVAFSYYLWTSTKILEPAVGETAMQTPETLRPALKVEGISDGSLVAHFSLTNIGTAPVYVLDTLALEPLFEVTVGYRAEASARFQPVVINAPQRDPRNKVYDPERDVIVPLSAGRSLSVPVRISNMFDIRKPGQYEITLSYQPEAVGAEMPRGEFDDLMVYRRPFKFIKASFNMPFAPTADPRKPAVPATAETPASPPRSPPPPVHRPGSSGVGAQDVFD